MKPEAPASMQLMPPEENKDGSKRKGQMVKKLKREFFTAPAFSSMLGLVQRCAAGISHPKIVVTVRFPRHASHFISHPESVETASNCRPHVSCHIVSRPAIVVKGST